MAVAEDDAVLDGVIDSVAAAECDLENVFAGERVRFFDVESDVDPKDLECVRVSVLFADGERVVDRNNESLLLTDPRDFVTVGSADGVSETVCVIELGSVGEIVVERVFVDEADPVLVNENDFDRGGESLRVEVRDLLTVVEADVELTTEGDSDSVSDEDTDCEPEADAGLDCDHELEIDRLRVVS